MSEALQKWWDILWDHPTYQMAVVLHPFYRLTWISKTMKLLKMSAAEQKRKLQGIKQIWLNFLTDHEAVSYDKEKVKEKEKRQRRNTAMVIEQAKSRTIESLNEKIFGDWTSADSVDEYDEYTAESSLKGIKNILEWWRDPMRQERWPVLSQLAVEIHSIPPMSDEVERVFSGGRRTISWERSRLSPETIEAIECFQHWLTQKSNSESVV
jgi:hypothetical protein